MADEKPGSGEVGGIHCCMCIKIALEMEPDSLPPTYLPPPVTTQLPNDGGEIKCVVYCVSFKQKQQNSGGNVGCSHITLQCASKFH